jgi:alpha-L-fucosidase
VPPTRDGVLADTDVTRLTAMHDRLTALFAADVAHGKHAAWHATGAHTAEASVDLGRVAMVSVVRLEENIARGQLVARHTLEARVGNAWQTLHSGTTIGHARIARFAPVTARQFRLTINDAVDAPSPITIKLYA